uniref:Mediator of RNA polymerase II transcription subunit 6 n=1 Tax=Phytophthora ramorum TaxID=164328 RepID=H3GGT7_PHYRM
MEVAAHVDDYNGSFRDTVWLQSFPLNAQNTQEPARRRLPQQLYIIRKQRRSGRTQVEPLAIYYVLDGTVYQAPNIHAMLTSRLKKCSYRVNKAFHGLAAGVRFSPTEGYAWDFSSKDKKEPVVPSEQLQLKLKQKYEKMEKQRENSARVDSILIQLMKKHAPEIAEKLENNAAAAAGASSAQDPAAAGAIKRENDATASTEAAKRQKVA